MAACRHFLCPDGPDHLSKSKQVVSADVEIRQGRSDRQLQYLWLDARDDIKGVGCYALRRESVYPVSAALRSWYHEIWKECRPAFLRGDPSSLYTYRLRLLSSASNETTLPRDATHREDTVRDCSSEIHNTVNGTQDTRNESGNKTHSKPVEVVDLVALSETLGEDSISGETPGREQPRELSALHKKIVHKDRSAHATNTQASHAELLRSDNSIQERTRQAGIPHEATRNVAEKPVKQKLAMPAQAIIAPHIPQRPDQDHHLELLAWRLHALMARARNTVKSHISQAKLRD